MFGMNFLGPLGMATMGDGRPDNSSGDLSALTEALKAARAAKHPTMGTPPTPQTSFGPGSANERVAQGFNAFGPTPLQTAMATPAPLPTPVANMPPPANAAPALMAAANAPDPAKPQDTSAPSPTPAPNPLATPAVGPTSVGGDPLSGTADQWASLGPQQTSGPDLINKLLSYFHQKDSA